MARKEEQKDKEQPQKSTLVGNLNVEAEKIEADEDDHEEDDLRTPLQKIIGELNSVANGSSVVDLRQAVVQNCPTQSSEVQAFMDKMRRLRDAAEAAYQTASEASAHVMNK
jgi:hypothetical protein